MEQTPETNDFKYGEGSLLYRFIYRCCRLLSPKYRLYGTENLPKEPCVIVGNHCHMYGPIAAEIYMPRPHYIWCAGEMMDRKEVPAYAYQDFWSGKPRRSQWFYHLLSHLIAPLAAHLFNNAHTIPVYRDTRVMTTYRRTVEKLDRGADVVIFPESYEPYNHIIWKLHEQFVDVARMYCRRTGKQISFVPMYLAPKLSSIHFGEPVPFNPEAVPEEERKRICNALMEAITAMAEALPEHIVIPYPNMPAKEYQKSKQPLLP